MSLKKEPCYDTDGGAIWNAGYRMGKSDEADVKANPYPPTHWAGEVWAEGFCEGGLDRLALSEPGLGSNL